MNKLVKLDTGFKDWSYSSKRIDRVKTSLPFVTSDQSILTHRVRAIHCYTFREGNKYRWDTMVVTCCGAKFHYNSKTHKNGNEFHYTNEPTKLLCSRCEANLKQLGMTPSDDLVGRELEKGTARSCSAKANKQ